MCNGLGFYLVSLKLLQNELLWSRQSTVLITSCGRQVGLRFSVNVLAIHISTFQNGATLLILRIPRARCAV